MARDALEIRFARAPVQCSVVLRDGLLEQLSRAEIGNAGTSCVIITDDLVARLYGKQLKEKLCGIARTNVITFPHGERSKTLNTVARITAKMSKLGCDRKTILFALGGGVAGDLGGFVASIFKRGIQYFQVPTTLLAMVDSSIGGKTGVDAVWGKNQLGSYYQPDGVFIDPSTLDTLPSSEIINGIAEMAKSGIIADPQLFAKIDSALNNKAIIDGLKPLIFNACKIKAEVVEKDEREANLRSTLNYGHTVGHALESSSGYRLSHGKSVLLGMFCEGWISSKLGLFEAKDYERHSLLLSRIRDRFNVRTPLLDQKKVLRFAFLDKKTSEGSLRMSLPEKIGKMHIAKDGMYTAPVSRELFLESLSQLRQERN
jgi:3-dehydroquinate synthase